MATVAAEAAVIGEALLGAALLLVWTAIEIIGYGGLLIVIVRRQRWLVVSAAPSRRAISAGAPRSAPRGSAHDGCTADDRQTPASARRHLLPRSQYSVSSRAARSICASLGR